jgi:hypothetical protein
VSAPPLTAQQVLLRAADWFEANPDRWGREVFYDVPSGCRCVLGGVALAVDPEDDDGDPTVYSLGGEASILLADYLTTVVGVHDFREDVTYLRDAVVQIVGTWNDENAKDASEVVTLLRVVAAWSQERAA